MTLSWFICLKWHSGRVPVCEIGDLRFKSQHRHNFFSQYLSYEHCYTKISINKEKHLHSLAYNSFSTSLIIDLSFCFLRLDFMVADLISSCEEHCKTYTFSHSCPVVTTLNFKFFFFFFHLSISFRNSFFQIAAARDSEDR